MFIFKKSLLKFIRPSQAYVYNVNDYVCLRLCEDFFFNFLTGKITSFQKLVLSLFDSANCLN